MKHQRTVTEARAFKISEQNGWTDYDLQLDKLKEEVNELSECKTEEERLNEISDIEMVLNSLRHILGNRSAQKLPYSSSQLLEIAIDKATKRQSDPNYLR